MSSGDVPPTSSSSEGRPSESLREIIRQELAAALRNMEAPVPSSLGESGKFLLG